MNLSKSSYLVNFLSHTISLLIIFLLLTATAVWTGKLFGHEIGKSVVNKEKLAQGVKMPNRLQIENLRLNPSTVILTPLDSAAWTVISIENGKSLGTIVSTAPYARNVKGFAGETPLYIYIGENGIIKSLTADDNSETPDFFQSAWEKLSERWDGLSCSTAVDLNVDAVSGATYSSQAIIANVQNTLSARIAALSETKATPTIGWIRTVSTVSVLLLGIIVFYFTTHCHSNLKRKQYFRIAMLVLNVCVLGFWCGQFLSISLLRGWIANGIDFIAWLPTISVLIVALLMSFLSKKHYYCTWICPYGSLQELAGRLPFPKIKIAANVVRWFNRIRLGILALLLISLWIGVGASILNYEPFTAFMIHTAPLAVTILASSFIVISMFIPRLWCRAFCPMGQLLDLSEKI